MFSAWSRYERREDMLVGTLGCDCIRRSFEYNKSALTYGYDSNSVFGHCHHSMVINSNHDNSDMVENVCFCIGREGVLAMELVLPLFQDN